MNPNLYATICIWVIFSGAFSPSTVVSGGFPTTLNLHRAIPLKDRVEVSQLRAHDRARHGRALQSVNGVVDFPVAGTFNPYRVGLYYTKVQLGSPAQEFYVQIDTGSDVLWIGCTGCTGCPGTTGLQDIQLNEFNPSSSSSSSVISCSDKRCKMGAQYADALCDNSNNCAYQFQYACSVSQTGDLTKTDRAVDGIFGFGQQAMSVVTQLSTQGITPAAFSHCLRGDDNGGGIMVLGSIVEPGIVYTPLVPSMPHYNLNMQSISVNGQKLAIDSSAFTTSTNAGTIIDSGTTLAYLAEEAYDPFVSAAGAAVWCMGFQKIDGQGMTILGDLVLKDKIVVYDLANQRVGWVNYDCSQSVNVSTSTGSNSNTYVNTGQLSSSISSMNPSYMEILFGVLVMLVSLMSM
uniref:Peptidase A1 domain-containing protein n=1 Tax=Chenopodium quinoa TaxID=63459 RepID=A0A803M6B2_CHEQI